MTNSQTLQRARLPYVALAPRFDAGRSEGLGRHSDQLMVRVAGNESQVSVNKLQVVRQLKTDDVPVLRFISQLPQPVIDARSSQGTEDVVFGFEGGLVVEVKLVNGALWLSTAELARALR